MNRLLSTKRLGSESGAGSHGVHGEEMGAFSRWLGEWERWLKDRLAGLADEWNLEHDRLRSGPFLCEHPERGSNSMGRCFSPRSHFVGVVFPDRLGSRTDPVQYEWNHLWLAPPGIRVDHAVTKRGGK